MPSRCYVTGYTSTKDNATIFYENNFLFLHFLYLKELTQGEIQPVKALKYFLNEEKISSDSVLLIGGMSLEKSVQYHGGKLFGKDNYR